MKRIGFDMQVSFIAELSAAPFSRKCKYTYKNADEEVVLEGEARPGLSERTGSSLKMHQKSHHIYANSTGGEAMTKSMNITSLSNAILMQPHSSPSF